MSGRHGLLVAMTPLALLVLFAFGSRWMGEGAAAGSESEPPTRRRAEPEEVRRFDEPASPSDQQAIEKMVGAHLRAISRNDYAEALQVAGPWVRRNWTPERFGEMVRRGLQPLQVAQTIGYERARTGGGTGRLLVTVRDRDGNATRYLFQLLQLEGRWFIDSCQPIDGYGAPLRPGAL